jgi:hypothetical protein
MLSRTRTLLLLLIFNCVLIPSIVHAKVNKGARDVIVITHLNLQDEGESKFWDKVYEFVERKGVKVTTKHLTKYYRKVHVIETHRKDKNKKATTQRVLALLKKVTSNSKVKAVDMIWMTHGHPKGKISLQATNKDGNRKIHVKDSLAPMILEELGENSSKLRMLFSTACFGEAAIKGWLKAGFKVVSGGKLVYTDSAASHPRFLKSWKKGSTFRQAIAQANKGQKRFDFWDKMGAISKRYTKDDLDSFRVIGGRPCLTISSNPNKQCK